MPCCASSTSSMKKLPVVVFASLVSTRYAASARISGLRHLATSTPDRAATRGATAPPLARSQNSAGQRYFAQANYTAHYLSWGATTVSMFWDLHPGTDTFTTSNKVSYVFSGDANGDGVSGNDLIYVPRNTGEMNFSIRSGSNA